MVAKENCTLYSGGLKGAETAFGEAAENMYGVVYLSNVAFIEDLASGTPAML